MTPEEHSTLLYLLDSIMVAKDKVTNLLNLAKDGADKYNYSEAYMGYLSRLEKTPSSELISVCKKIKEEIR